MRGAGDIVEWLTGDESHDLDDVAFAVAFGGHLAKAGLPIDRLTLHWRTLHPEYWGRSIAWSPGETVQIADRAHGLAQSAMFLRHPIRHVMETREWLTARNPDTRFPRWAELDLFKGRGLVEMIVAPLPQGKGPASAAAFATTRPDGFSGDDRRMLEALVPALRGASEVRVLRHAEQALLDTYVGAATGRRILAGHIRRGDVETLDAALFLCDLRGFTALSDRLPGETVLAALNAYFDQAVPAIEEQGGEILKFMGDAVLAYFHVDGDPARSCRAAFAAARQALTRLAGAVSPAGILRAGVALHYGEVSYGNIGSGHRLDFTVIGRDVNLTSRLQGLCEATGHPILMSRRFAELLGAGQATGIGRYPLKGLGEPVEVFAPGE